MLAVANVLGRLMTVFSLAYAVPIAGSVAFGDGIAVHFLVSMLLTLAIGAMLLLGTRAHYRELKVRDGFLLVTLSWTIMGAIAALPFMIVYAELSFTDAFFETMSAMTTTGATTASSRCATASCSSPRRG